MKRNLPTGALRRLEQDVRALHSRSGQEDSGALLQTAVQRGYLTSEQARAARDEGGSVEEAVVRLGFLSSEQLAKLIRESREAEAIFEIGKYEIVERVGEGGSAVVYRARDRELDRPVALKILRENSADDPVLRKRFEREGQTAAALTHPHVVKVHETGEWEGRLYMVLELVEGASLSHALRSGRFELDKALDLMDAVAAALQSAHERGVVHRDLKPANILMTADGTPKVTDFGLAHLQASQTLLTRTGARLGTPAYMAPEQVLGKSKEVTARTDVYALGAILYRSLTGRTPFDGESPEEVYSKITGDEPVPIRKLRPEVPADLEAICRKAMEKEPEFRYSDAGAFREDLLSFREGRPVSARIPSIGTKTWRALAARKAIVGTVAAALLLGSVFAVVFLSMRDDPVDPALHRAEKHLAAGRNHLRELETLLGSSESAPEEIQARAESAREEFGKAATASPVAKAEAHVGMARACRLEGDLERAREYCESAIDADGTFEPAYRERAWISLEQFEERRHVGVETTGLAALILEDLRRPGGEPHPEGLLLFVGGEFGEAAPLLQDAGEWRRAGHAWLHVADSSKKAIHALTRAIGLRPRDALSFLLRAEAQFRSGGRAEAERDLNSVLDLRPGFHAALALRGEVREADRNRKAAIADYEKALRNAPAGWNRRGDLEETLAKLRQDVYGRSWNERPTVPEFLKIDKRGWGEAYTAYSITSKDPDGDEIRYRVDCDCGTGKGSGSWYDSGAMGVVTHMWPAKGGLFHLRVRAEDRYGGVSDWSDPVEVEVSPNHAPDPPTLPSGPTELVVGRSYSFTSTATDPEGDKVRLKFKWGRNKTSFLETGPSGKLREASHVWTKPGRYQIEVQAWDEHMAMSEGSEKLEVTVVAED